MESSILLSGVEVSQGAIAIEPESLYARLARLTDPRARRGRRYPLALIVTLVLLAKLAGESKPSAIAEWVRLRQSWLLEALALRSKRLPCANTYTRVCGQVNLSELNALLAAYCVPPLPPLPPEVPLAERSEQPRAQRHLALDGKTLRGTDRRGVEAVAPQQIVSLYDVRRGGALNHLERPLGMDERVLAKQLIAGYDLRGCVISADALHTQPSWCRQVRAQGGDYLLWVKKNQPLLRSEIAELFAAPLPRWLDERTARSVNKGHGRLEVRQLRVSSELAQLLAPTWHDAAQVFRLDRTISRHGQTTQESVYGLTSLPATVADAPHLLHLIRQHWLIENRLHWRRDVTLREDSCLVRAGPAALVLALLNTAVLALMDQLRVTNLPAQMRCFMADPSSALSLLLSNPDF